MLLRKASFHVLGLTLRISSPFSAGNIKRLSAYQVVFLQAPRKAQNKTSICCGTYPRPFPGLEQPKEGACDTRYLPILFSNPSNDNMGNTVVPHGRPLGSTSSPKQEAWLCPDRRPIAALCPSSATCH